MPHAHNNDIKIHYEVHGEGEPLVFLHGFTSKIQQWKFCGYVDELKKSHNLVLIDLRGHGKSDKPHDPEAYRLEERMADVKAVLTDLRIDRAHLFGYSMGGWIAFGMAVHFPELVQSLIVGGGHPYEDTLQTFSGVDGSDPDAFIVALEGFIGEKIADDARPIVLQNDLVALAAAAGYRRGFQKYLTSIDKPILLFVGDRDNRYALVQRAATELNAKQLVVLPAAGHATSLFASAALLPHVKAFLKHHSIEKPWGFN